MFVRQKVRVEERKECDPGWSTGREWERTWLAVKIHQRWQNICPGGGGVHLKDERRGREGFRVEQGEENDRGDKKEKEITVPGMVGGEAGALNQTHGPNQGEIGKEGSGDRG